MNNVTDEHTTTASIFNGDDANRMITSLISIIILMAVTIIHRWIKPFHVPNSVPGPKREPLLGILRFIINNWENWPEKCVELSNLYKRTWGGPILNVGGLGGAVFFLTDDACLRYVLNDNFDNYVKGDSFQDLLGELLGDGIFASDGDAWKMHRKIASTMFTKNLLRHSAKVMCDKLKDFETVLRKASDDGKSLNLQDLFFCLTIDTVAYIVFGVELNSILKGSQHRFAIAFDNLQHMSHLRFQDPLYKIKRVFQITERERMIRKELAVLDEFAYEIINSKRRSAENGEELGADLLSRYMASSISNCSNKNDKSEAESEKFFRHIIMNFVIAGRDTTACALSWTFYELIRRPDVVEAIRKEVASVIGEGDDTDYSLETLGKLKYTHCVIMEVLRLHPSVPNILKFCVRDDTLPDGTFIPAGSSMCYAPMSFGRSEARWGKDYAEFKPERFLSQSEPSAYLFPVFNAGYRTCLGKPMAIMNMKLILAYLLPRFDFAEAEPHSGAGKWTLVRSMRDGFFVSVSKKE